MTSNQTRERPMPPWLRRFLAETGRLDTDGVRRKARLRSCRRCGGRVMVGLDAEPCGLPVRVDPTDLSPIAEVLALLQRRATYDLTGRAPNGPWLDYRAAEHIRVERRYPVLPDHRCRSGSPDAVLLRIDAAVLAAFHPYAFVKSASSQEPPF
jgi:hypothetical protein